MPTKRFLSLPDEKKQVIEKAIIEEFSRVPFEKASINQIVKNADISRGSFYTYFEDKRDALDFIWEELLNQIRSVIHTLLAENKGDYFDTFERLLEMSLAIPANEPIVCFCKNACDSAIASYSVWGADRNRKEVLGREMQSVMEKINPEQLKIKHVEDFTNLSMLLLMNLSKTLYLFYHGEHDVSVLKRIHKSGIELLKYGALSA